MPDRTPPADGPGPGDRPPGDAPGPARDFAVPDLGEGLEDVTVVRWLVAPGDEVALNQPLCTVETAKAEVDVPSPWTGRIVALGGGEGDTLAVGALLARIAPTAAAPAAAPPATGPATDPASRATAPARPITEPASQAEAGPAGSGGGPGILVGYGPGGAPGPGHRHRPAGPTGGRPRARPPVRRLARRLDVDLGALVPGSGPDGVVTRADVEAAAASTRPAGHDRAAPDPVPAGTAGPDGTVTPHPGSGPARNGAAGRPAPGTTIPVRGVRARIAGHLSESHARIPDASCRVVADCTRLLEVRALLDAHTARRDGTPRGPLTPFSLLARLAVLALADAPVLNASFLDEGPAIRVHDTVHLGVATATDRGLLVTVVRDAGTRSLPDLAGEIARLAGAARAGTAAPDELRGSTFTITNFGALGLDDGVPVINHPEAAILGVGAIRRRPHVVGDEVVARSTASLTLVFDHRVCDGAEAAAYLCGLRDLIETPELALLAM